jgi:hypothetical protein
MWSGCGQQPSFGSRVLTTGHVAALDEAGSEMKPGGGADLVGYSPITAQRKPIMMKKPLNRAMRPMPP